MKRKLGYVSSALFVLAIAVLMALNTVAVARPMADSMEYPLITIPEGSTHASYDGNYVSGDRTIDLTTGWTTNLPSNVCAVAVRFAYKDDTVNNWGALRPNSSDAFAVLARVQAANVWSDSSGIVPIIDSTADLHLDINSAGYVYIEITGYWVCEVYQRPTPGPSSDE